VFGETQKPIGGETVVGFLSGVRRLRSKAALYLQLLTLVGRWVAVPPFLENRRLAAITARVRYLPIIPAPSNAAPELV